MDFNHNEKVVQIMTSSLAVYRGTNINLKLYSSVSIRMDH